MKGFTAVRRTAAKSRPTSPPARPPVRSAPVTPPSRTSRGRPPNRQTSSPAPAASRIPAVVAPVSPGSGAESNFGMSPPGASASTHSATRVVNHAANRHPSAWIPGAMGIRRRRSRATTSSTHTTNGTRSIAMVTSANQPRSTFPDRKRAGSPPRSMVTAEFSSATTLAVAAPARASCGGIEVVQAEVLPGGARRERHGRDVAGDQRPLLLGRIRDAVAGELVVEPRCLRRHPVEGLEAVAGDRVDRRRRAPGRVGAQDDPERRPARSRHVVEHDRGDDPRPQRPRRAEGGRALGPGGPAVGRDEHEPAIGRHGPRASARAGRGCRCRPHRRRSSRRDGR